MWVIPNFEEWGIINKRWPILYLARRTQRQFQFYFLCNCCIASARQHTILDVTRRSCFFVSSLPAELCIVDISICCFGRCRFPVGIKGLKRVFKSVLRIFFCINSTCLFIDVMKRLLVCQDYNGAFRFKGGNTR